MNRRANTIMASDVLSQQRLATADRQPPARDVDLAQSLMKEFANSTGITGSAPPRRYLWTDAFAVCNFLGLFRQTGDLQYLKHAKELVDQVHHTLGRHRPDDFRHGWISGLSEIEGERHPTQGGLRIGKRLPERKSDRDWDPRLEWERDGQYFHYLTKWMHALHRMGRELSEPHYLQWAIELSTTAHERFVTENRLGGNRRLAWKMSIDLSRPLVPTMGQHDPLDGLVTALELRQAAQSHTKIDCAQLNHAIADFSEMCRHAHWATEDPLGIGGLLEDIVRMTGFDAVRPEPIHHFIRSIVFDLGLSFEALVEASPFDRPAEQRLAFRELGLAIGMRGLESRCFRLSLTGQRENSLERLLRYRPLAEEIISFWADHANRRCPLWQEHGDINAVMLATSLVPAGYFEC